MTQQTSFKDYFSDRSARYAQYRPNYPDSLFCFLADRCRRHERAWDCATGNGQSALGLIKFFEEVIATDASAAQIEAAIPSPGVHYRVAAAERSELPEQSVDLLTVGQALHWFQIQQFFEEAQRVVRPGGVVATWFYKLCNVSAAVDSIVDRLYGDIVDEFWPPERHYIENDYAGIPYPAPLLDVPEFSMRASWSVDDMLGYLGTWSACKRYTGQHGHDPVALIEAELREAWGTAAREVTWPLVVRAYRLPD